MPTSPPTLIFGTPSLSWSPSFADHARRNNPELQERFQGWHDRLFGADTREVGGWAKLPGRSSAPHKIAAADFPREWDTDTGASVLLSDPRACWTAAAWVEAIPTLRLVAFYELPEDFVALHAGHTEPETLLPLWEATARNILTLVKRHRANFTLLSMRECREQGPAFEALCKRQLGLGLPPAVNNPTPPADLPLALATLQASAERSCPPLLAELEASSHALTPDQAPPSTNRKSTARKAWEQWRELQELVTSTKDTTEENELLLLQLHQVQEELEHYFLENRKLQRARLLNGGSEGSLLRAEGLRLGHAHDQKPHRHLNFTLEGANLGERTLGNVPLRLVEHHGRPGLAIFQPSGAAEPPLYHWKASGEENGQPYQLVVPQDPAGRDFLLAAPTSDLLLLRNGALILAAHLESSEDTASSPQKRDWSRVARFFAALTDDLTSRLHYDDIECTYEDRSPCIRLNHVWLPGRYLGNLEFIWRDSSIIMQDTSALTAWPRDTHGNPLAEAVFDLSPSADSRKQRALWSGLTDKDRQLMTLVASELPNFVHHLIRQHPQAKIDKDTLLKRARSMKKRAESLAPGHRTKRFFGLLNL